MAVALCLNLVDGKKYALLTTVAVWSAASMTMNVVNKMAVMLMPAPMTLLIIQMLIAVLLLLVMFGPMRLWIEIRDNGSAAKRWTILSFFLVGALVTSLLALMHGSVILMLITRNLMPLLTLIFEGQLLPEDSCRPVTCEAVSALLTLAFGTTLYAFTALNTSASWTVLGLIFLNMVIMLLYRLAERYLLLGMPKSLSFGALNLLQNAAGLLPAILLFFVWGEHRTMSDNLLRCSRDPMTLAIISFSGCAGLALGYYSIVLQKAVTATSFLTIQCSMKVMTILLAVVVLGEHPGILGTVGCLISLGGGAWYGFLGSRPNPSSSSSGSCETKT
jgi:drug/metabolite transporter (DMT)-like permease